MGYLPLCDWATYLCVSPVWRERPYHLTIFNAQHSAAIYAFEGDTSTRVQWCERERAWLFRHRNCSAPILPTVDYRPVSRQACLPLLLGGSTS